MAKIFKLWKKTAYEKRKTMAGLLLLYVFMQIFVFFNFIKNIQYFDTPIAFFHEDEKVLFLSHISFIWLYLMLVYVPITTSEELRFRTRNIGYRARVLQVFAISLITTGIHLAICLCFQVTTEEAVYVGMYLIAFAQLFIESMYYGLLYEILATGKKDFRMMALFIVIFCTIMRIFSIRFKLFFMKIFPIYNSFKGQGLFSHYSLIFIGWSIFLVIAGEMIYEKTEDVSCTS